MASGQGDTAISMGLLIELQLELNETEKYCQCENCGAIETLFFNGGKLVPTKRWYQENGRVYHRCWWLHPAVKLSRI